MPTLVVSLDIKFRALFTDLFKFSQSWSLALPEITELAGSRTLLDFNQRGVHLVLALRK